MKTKYTKTIFAILLSGVFVFGTCACGMDSGDKEEELGSIEASVSKLTLHEGDEDEIEIENYDDLKKLDFEVEDDDIIEVEEDDDGIYIVTALEEGKTSITFSAKDCEDLTIKVTVKEALAMIDPLPPDSPDNPGNGTPGQPSPDPKTGINPDGSVTLYDFAGDPVCDLYELDGFILDPDSSMCDFLWYNSAPAEDYDYYYICTMADLGWDDVALYGYELADDTYVRVWDPDGNEITADALENYDFTDGSTINAVIDLGISFKGPNGKLYPVYGCATASYVKEENDITNNSNSLAFCFDDNDHWVSVFFTREHSWEWEAADYIDAYDQLMGGK